MTDYENTIVMEDEELEEGLGGKTDDDDADGLDEDLDDEDDDNLDEDDEEV